MDYLDDYYDESRPRFVFQSRAPQPPPPPPPGPTTNKPLLILCLCLSISILLLACSFHHSQLLQSLSVWLALSLLVGPFAPPQLTAGDVRVGLGEPVQFPPQTEEPQPEDPKKKKRNRPARRPDPDLIGPAQLVINSGGDRPKGEGSGNISPSNGVIEEKEWTEEDVGLLRKQISKHPVGKPKRWEVISEAFNGRHSVESVINKAKSLGKEKPADSDSYSKFLKDRKPVDKRAEGGDGEIGSRESGGEVVSSWSSAEDMALLNALKTFPKEVAMRWEKIAAAVPGKSKAACMKRVSELKKEFRSSKAASEN